MSLENEFSNEIHQLADEISQSSYSNTQTSPSLEKSSEETKTDNEEEEEEKEEEKPKPKSGLPPMMVVPSLDPQIDDDEEDEKVCLKKRSWTNKIRELHKNVLGSPKSL